MKTKTILYRHTVRYLTADDVPSIITNASLWLDTVQKVVGGVRGYGGEGFSGHWLKLTRSQWQKFQLHADKTFPA